MKFQTHNETEVNIFKTCWTLSTIQATRTALCKAFGAPIDTSGAGDKVNFEWNIQFEDGRVATIYDWKEDPVADDAPVTWHIGANPDENPKEIVGLVHDVYRAAHGLTCRSAA